MTEKDNNGKPEPSKGYHIRIDRTDYVVTQEKLDGEQLRHVPRDVTAITEIPTSDH